MNPTTKQIAQILNILVKTIEYFVAELIVFCLVIISKLIVGFDWIVGLGMFVGIVATYRIVTNIEVLFRVGDMFAGFVDKCFVRGIMTPYRTMVMWIERNK